MPDHQQSIRCHSTGSWRRGATTEAYGTIRRKEGAIEGNAVDDALLGDQGRFSCLNGPYPYDSVSHTVWLRGRCPGTLRRDW